mmetsp:Transcript_40521/g.86482  ORF Transcript_40521/g.86482 Transcript_40521/m.86482 type:complete len:110 (+) Transcript_40521:756-1085(+)
MSVGSAGGIEGGGCVGGGAGGLEGGAGAALILTFCPADEHAPKEVPASQVSRTRAKADAAAASDPKRAVVVPLTLLSVVGCCSNVTVAVSSAVVMMLATYSVYAWALKA